MYYDYDYGTATGIAAGAIIGSLVFGLVMCVVFVLICGAIAKNKGLPSSYRWFGLLGLIGLIIVLVASPKNTTPPYQNGYYYPYQNQNQQPPYPPQQYPPQQYAPYQQQPNQQQPAPQQAPAIKYCPTCGRQIDANAKICPFCSRAV
jgi:hypothetical protein